MNRVRFAPSPTGSLHVGGVRTALYNWLWSKKIGGQFILRIEDTDFIRNDPSSYDNILRTLDWLGLHWDEGPDINGKFGPYTQSDRRDFYKAFANSLIADGKAYRCNCSMQQLMQWKSQSPNWKYPGICRDKNIDSSNSHVVRLKVDTDAIISYNDLVFGKITTPTSSLYDFVLLRENGIPLYNFAAVVDDHLMHIDLVARGRDHMINTPNQILLYNAFGWDLPSFAHLPMLLNMQGDKLSKRDGSVSVNEFRKLGFSANGLLNYLLRFGWSHGDQELFSMGEMIELFSWESCKKSDGRFDMAKALAINGKNLMRSNLVSNETYIKDLASFGICADDKIIEMVRAKAKSYLEAKELLSFLVDGALTNYPMDIPEDGKIHISNLLKIYSQLSLIDKDALVLATKSYCQENNLNFPNISQLLRHYFTGKTIGPDIYKIIEYLCHYKNIH